MTQYRRIDRDVANDFFRLFGNKFSSQYGVHVLVEEYDDTNGGSKDVFFGGIETIERDDIPAPVKELLCSSIRGRLVVENKELEQDCLKDKLKSRRARGLSTGTLFSCMTVCSANAIAALPLSKDIKEIVYNDPV